MMAVHRGERWWPSSNLYPQGTSKTASTVMGESQHSRSFVIDHHGIWGQDVRWPGTIDMYTDGSWHAPASAVQSGYRGLHSQERANGVSAWSVCVSNSWLCEQYGEVEVEGKISERTRKRAFVFGGRIDGSMGEGNFDAELTAIARGLMCVPVGVPCCIHTDSKSSIQAIKAYRSLSLHEYRRRLRMAGRPLLALIAKVMAAKEVAGGGAELRWVKAHTKEMSLHHVGNRLADDYAGALCDEKRSQAIRHKVSRALPLHQHEQFVALRVRVADGGVSGGEVGDSDGKRGTSSGRGVRNGGDSGNASGRIITGDPRRAAWRRMVEQCGAAWTTSQSQSLYSNNAEVDARGLWLFAERQMPTACGFIVLALSNAWQWRRTDRTRDSNGNIIEQRVMEQRCMVCHGEPVMNVAHLTFCTMPAVKRLRERAVDEVMSVLHYVGLEGRPGPMFSQWTSLMHEGDERPLRAMVTMFGLVDAGSVPAVTAACFGAFNGARMKRVLRSDWGIADGQRRDTIINDLRRSLIKWAFEAAEACKKNT